MKKPYSLIRLYGSKETKMNIDFIKKVKIFDTLEDSEAEKVLSLIKIKELIKGDIVFNEGDMDSTIYIVEEGRVKVIHEISPKESKTLATLTKYDVFGELAIFDSSPRSATVMAADITRLCVIKSDEFLDLLNSDNNIAAKVYKEIIIEVADRLRRANEKLQDNITWGLTANL